MEKIKKQMEEEKKKKDDMEKIVEEMMKKQKEEDAKNGGKTDGDETNGTGSVEEPEKAKTVSLIEIRRNNLQD